MTDTIYDEIRNTIKDLKWGSVEVIVQDGEVTQISTRIIKKTAPKIEDRNVRNIQKSRKNGINLNFKY
jgi:hypothetical protein